MMCESLNGILEKEVFNPLRVEFWTTVGKQQKNILTLYFILVIHSKIDVLAVS